jgi:SnoaL-like domain
MSVSTLAPPLTEAEKALVTKEVLEAVKAMFTAAKNMDPDYVLDFCLNTSEFQITWFNGITNNYTESDKTWQEFVSKFKSQEIEIHSQKVNVLAADTVLHCWQGKCELMKIDGGSVRLDPFAMTGLLRKIGKEWKIVSRTDSGILTVPPNPANLSGPN